MTPTTDHVITRAAAIAAEAHRGQRDKAGQDYLTHPERVAARLQNSGHSPAVVAAGWLHDVLEDTSVTAEELLADGIPARTVEIVELLSRPDHEDYETYLGRLAAEPQAAAVKRADMADNSDPERLARLDAETAARLRRKYARAAAILETSERALG